MKKSLAVATILFSLAAGAADFKWSHSYQDGCSRELTTLANKLCQGMSSVQAPTEGFSIERPAFSLKCGKGVLLFEKDDRKTLRTVYFEGTATVSFGVDDPLEQSRLERYLGKKRLENEPVGAVYIVPFGACADLPPAASEGPPGQMGRLFQELKQALRRNAPETLARIMNDRLTEADDMMILFKLRGDVWAYSYDSQSETEVQLLRLAHPPSQDYFMWDPAVAMHRSGAGALTTDVMPGEISSKYFADAKSYDINYTMDDNGKLLKGEVTVKVLLKRPHSALVFDYFPDYGISRVTVNGEEAYFLKETYSEKWGYYESGVLVAFKSPLEGEVTVKFSTDGPLFKQAEGYLYLRDEDYWYPHLPDWDGALYRMTATVPKENEVIAVGDLKSRVTNPDSTETFVWEMDVPVTLATFVVGKFIHKNLDAEGLSLDVALPRGVRTNLLTQAQEYTLNELKNNIVFYTKMFGPLPFKTLKVAVTPYSHGRGFPTMLLLTDSAFFRYGSTWPDQLMAHEVSHQWWGNLVDGLTYRDLWLSEGMAEFSSMLYMGLRFGEDKVKMYHEDMILSGMLMKRSTLESAIDADDYRPAHLYRPGKPFSVTADARVPFDEGPICLGERLYSTATTQSDLGYNYVIYTKGNFVFQMLLSLSKFTKEGNAGFFRGLQSICSKYRGQKVSTPVFFKELEATMKIPLSAFLDSWYKSTGIPKVEVKTATLQKDGKFFVTAEGKCDSDLFFGVPLRVTMPDKKKYDYVLLFQNRASKAEWPVPQKPRDIDVDPMRVVFCTYGKVKQGN